MQRANNDSWDLKTGVGTTATMVAAARAVASKQPDPLINDPFAESLVRAVGLRLFTQLVDGHISFSEIGAGWFPDMLGIRTKTFDDFIADACRVNVRQLVLLASGLDCRAYRLDWPPSMAVYEVDQPAVVDWKTSIVSSWGCSSSAQHRCVGIDLRQDWLTALRQAGFNDAAPTVWIVEGLLVGFLPPSAHDQILNAITTLSATGSRIAADYIDVRHPDVVNQTLGDLHAAWRQRDRDLNLRGLTFSGPRQDPAVYLSERGWTTWTSDLLGHLRAAGRISPQQTTLPYPLEHVRIFRGIRN